MSRVLIMAAGTGGHVFPALELARALRERHWQVEWLGTGVGLEARLVPAAGIPLHRVAMRGVRGRGWRQLLRLPLALLSSLCQSLGIIRRNRPDLVVGFGGYVTLPGGIAAWLSRCPLLIHEQNALPGTSNRLLAPLARRVLCAFAGTFDAKSRRVRVIGNPVRPEIRALAPPQERFAGRAGAPLQLLVLGGSQGAAAINRILPGVLSQSRAGAWQVVHQTGPGDRPVTEKTYREAGVSARVVEFIADMAAAYAAADLVLCRAGALTVSELLSVGVGAVLVPFPHAIDDHQAHNGKVLVRAGGGFLVREGPNLREELTALLGRLHGDRDALLGMARAARAALAGDATLALVRDCEELRRG